MRTFTQHQYLSAIGALQMGMTQLVPDGRECQICGDPAHFAFQCGWNPLVATALCEELAGVAATIQSLMFSLAGCAVPQGGLFARLAEVALPAEEEEAAGEEAEEIERLPCSLCGQKPQVVTFAQGKLIGIDCTGNDTNHSDEEGWEECIDESATGWYETEEEAWREWNLKHAGGVDAP